MSWQKESCVKVEKMLKGYFIKGIGWVQRGGGFFFYLHFSLCSLCNLSGWKWVERHAIVFYEVTSATLHLPTNPVTKTEHEGTWLHDCTRNFVPKSTILIATAVKAKALFERLYLVSCWGTYGIFCLHALGTHFPTTHCAAIFQFLCNCSQSDEESFEEFSEGVIQVYSSVGCRVCFVFVVSCIYGL